MSDSESSSEEDDSGESEDNEKTYWVSDFPMVLSNKTTTATTQARQEQMGNKRSETGAAQNSGGCPPLSLWKSSRAKQRIIEALKDNSSDIHLFIGKYSASDFSSVNFGGIMQQYSC